jgi:putative ABC transport system permease protein
MLALAYLLRLEHSLLLGGVAWPSELLLVPGLALGISLAAALLPAFGAYRSDVLEMLQTR